MCVHSHDTTSYRGWGYYAGPRDTRDPEEAFPHWKHDDPSLVLRCVPRSVSVDSRREPDPSRAPLLRNLYRRAGRLMRGKTYTNNTHEMYLDLVKLALNFTIKIITLNAHRRV